MAIKYIAQGFGDLSGCGQQFFMIDSTEQRIDCTGDNLEWNKSSNIFSVGGDVDITGTFHGKLPNSEITATGSTITTSSTDVPINSMTLTPGSGDYLIWFSASWELSLGNMSLFASVYVNGVQIAASERELSVTATNKNHPFTVSTHGLKTSVGDSQDIDIRWRVTAGTATMFKRTITILKVG